MQRRFESRKAVVHRIEHIAVAQKYTHETQQIRALPTAFHVGFAGAGTATKGNVEINTRVEHVDVNAHSKIIADGSEIVLVVMFTQDDLALGDFTQLIVDQFARNTRQQPGIVLGNQIGW